MGNKTKPMNTLLPFLIAIRVDDSPPLPGRGVYILHRPSNLRMVYVTCGASLYRRMTHPYPGSHMIFTGQRKGQKCHMPFPSRSLEPTSSSPCLSFLFHWAWVSDERWQGTEPHLTHNGHAALASDMLLQFLTITG